MTEGICDHCKRRQWVNWATYRKRGVSVAGNFCADCFDALLIPESHGKAGGGDAGPNHNDPGFDNVIRAAEEDR